MPLTTNIKVKCIYGFDIETYGDYNKFLMGSIIGDNGIKAIFWNKEKMIEYILNNAENKLRHGYIMATNLQFDILSLFNESSQFKNIEPLIRNSKMLCCKLGIDKDNKKKLIFSDTLNFASFSVEKWGKILNIPKLEKPKCFGKKPKNEDEIKELERYNLNDSFITYKAGKFLQQGFNTLGAEMKITIASTSLDLFRRKFQKDIFYQPQEKYLKFLFNGYYGGRCEVIKRGLIKNLKYYDFNSLYPSVMINEYPMPNNFKYSNFIKLNTIMEYEGVVKIKIKAPDLYIPYLPLRTEKPNIKLLFPKGIFTGYYSFFEIRKAIELGYKIIKFYDGIIYFKKFMPFKEYIEQLYKERLKNQINNSSMELINKLFMNSLYGKFAQKIEYKEIIVHESKVDIKMINASDNVFRSGNFFIFKKRYDKIPAFVNPIFSIYTTAYARDKLYNILIKNPNSVYYYDTDSIISNKDFETSHNLGDLKLEYNIKEGILVKPKMYIINETARCKGIGFLNKKEFNELIKNKKFIINKFVKFKECNRRNLYYNQKLEVLKQLNLEDNKRIWEDKFNPNVLQDSCAIEI